MVLLTQGPIPTDTMIDVGGHRLHFRIIQGHGATIVLASGGGMNATQWDSLAPNLARSTGATVVAYDRAGFGTSDASDAAYDIHREAGDLWSALERLGLDGSLVLVGHSYGGFLIEALAAQHPSAVRGLVFVDPNTAHFIAATGGPGVPDRARRNGPLPV
ncbi:MAG: alpha/beta fold hydrolase [Gemmatimonadota bacterium]